jgi:tellurite methyltransferase
VVVDRERLPEGVELVRTTPELDEETVPAGLLRDHRLAEGVWGRLVVIDGDLGFAFDDEDGPPRRLGPGEHVVMAPGRTHRVVPDGPVRFVIEFHRAGAER